MKKFFFSGYVVLICVVFLSCNTSLKDKHSVPFVELFSNDVKLNEDSVLLKYPYRIVKEDSLLLIWDLHGNEHFFHAFNLIKSKTEYLFSFGTIGQGPEELIACGGMDIQDGLLSVVETNKSILYTYPIENLKRKITKPNRILELPKELIPIVKFTDRGKDGEIVLDSKGEYRFILLNDKGEIESKLYNIPNEENKDLANPILQQLWISCLDFNPKNNVLVIATVMGDVIEIYNLKNNKKNIVIGEQGEPNIKRDGRNLIIRAAYGYQDVIVGDTEIYALYSKITHEEIDEATKNGLSTPSGGNLINVLDFNGNIKKVFVLDRFINGFDIDFNENTIYGVTSNSNTQLCVFKM
ncbi:MAG: hypothetical protein GX639_18745 [Fibrobacter sp.]|nr:hypothetical protein [Fibrobacter sp.]